ncbi:hypothetical protein DPEC_G00003430 [Dallia pectoralis]|uniref:Uncharacterized protein n=1 Tax=Dallia pectoralis TaxID=75939 RepID=A0ACC2HJ89_DALPE|nr:hypothetical protein DPEC_G00003430 [Dallia pectoralis]
MCRKTCRKPFCSSSEEANYKYIILISSSIPVGIMWTAGGGDERPILTQWTGGQREAGAALLRPRYPDPPLSGHAV